MTSHFFRSVQKSHKQCPAQPWSRPFVFPRSPRFLRFEMNSLPFRWQQLSSSHLQWKLFLLLLSASVRRAAALLDVAAVYTLLLFLGFTFVCLPFRIWARCEGQKKAGRIVGGRSGVIRARKLLLSSECRQHRPPAGSDKATFSRSLGEINSRRWFAIARRSYFVQSKTENGGQAALPSPRIHRADAYGVMWNAIRKRFPLC